jgi:hypothetical protein
LWFWLFFVVLMVLVVAGRAPWGTPCHQILVVFDGFGGVVFFVSWFWVLLVGPHWAHPTIRF